MEGTNSSANVDRMQNTCIKCRGENHQAAAFCMHCGNPLSRTYSGQQVAGYNQREVEYKLQEDVYNPACDLSRVPDNLKEDMKHHKIAGRFPVAAAVILSIITLGIFSYIYYGIKHSKLPKVKQDDFSAGKAIGFLFIPFVNLAWIFVFWTRLVDRLNLQFRLRNQEPVASKGLAIATLIVFYVTTIITYISGSPVSLIGVVMIAALAGNIQYACNKLSILNGYNTGNDAYAWNTGSGYSERGALDNKNVVCTETDTMGQERTMTENKSIMTGNESIKDIQDSYVNLDFNQSCQGDTIEGNKKKPHGILGWILVSISAVLTIVFDIALIADNSSYVLGPVKGISILTFIIFLPVFMLGVYLLYRAEGIKYRGVGSQKEYTDSNDMKLNANRLRQIKLGGIYGAAGMIALLLILSGIKIYINTGERSRTYDHVGVYEGRLYMGQREGTGTMRYENGDEYKGQWLKDKKHGQGVYTYANGDVYEGRFMSDRFNGRGKMKYANGDVYEGEWRNGKRNGQGTLLSANGEQVKGEWRDNVLLPPKNTGISANKGVVADNPVKKPALGSNKNIISPQVSQRSGELTIEQGNKPGDFKITMTGNSSEYCFDTPKVSIGPNLKVPVSIFSARIDSQGMLSPGIKTARTTMSNAKINTVYGAGKSISSRDIFIGNLAVEGMSDSQYIKTGPDGVVLEKNGTKFTVLRGNMELAAD